MSDIRDLKPGDHDLIGSIIGESFADDPVNQYVFRSEAGITRFYIAMARKLYLQNGFGHVTEDGSGGTMWLPPGVSKEIPIWKNLDIAVSMTRHGGLASLRNGTQVDACLAKHKPKVPFYYLFTIGTLPEHQGKGIGGGLMKAGLEIVDQAGMPAYLESSKFENVPFYRRFGFEITQEVSPGSDAPSLWLMYRDAVKG